MLTSRQPEPSPGDGSSPGNGPDPDVAVPGGAHGQHKEQGERDRQPPAAPMTSVQTFESPDDAEANYMADQRSADRATTTDREPDENAEDENAEVVRGTARVQPEPVRGTATVQPDRPRGSARVQPEAARGEAKGHAQAGPTRVRPSSPELTDVQTSSGVPPTPTVTPTVAPPPAVVEPTRIPIVPTRIPVVPGRPGAVRPTSAPAPDPARAPKAAQGRRAPLDLGHAPIVLAVSALGVLLVAFAYTGGRDGWSGATTLYWIGQIVVFTPVVLRLLSRRLAGVAESFLLVMGLAVNQYLLKWMYSPDQLRFPDELQHWLATTVLIQTGELFQPNQALPPAVHFPGLAEMAAAVTSMTGMTVTTSGIIVAGVTHLVFVGALFMAALRASRSPAVAGVACALYATAMHYLFFNSMFLYQTAALPFFMLTIWATRRWLAGGGRPFAALAVASICVTTVSHHVTAFTLVATLSLLAVTELIIGRPRRRRVLVMPAVSLAVIAAWILFVATDVIAYLEEPINQVMTTISQLMSDSSDAASTTAAVSVVQLVVQGAGLLGLFVLYLACVRDMIHRHDRDAWRWAAVAGSFIFFAGSGVRFLGQNGPEISGRLQTFTYIPIAILASVALVRGVQIIPLKDAEGHRWRAAAPAFDYPAAGDWHLWTRVAAGSALITLLMIGARAGGWPPIGSILPGPYLAGGFERSVDAYGVDAANWERTTLGHGNRIGGDVTSVSLASTYGRQDPVREVASLYYATEWGLAQDEQVDRLRLRYLVVDKRLGEQLPESGAYFEDDPHAGRLTSPLSRTQLGKFDSLTDVDRLYDNGNVRIYRMGDE